MTDEIVGIDLGTTNSEIAVYRNGRPEVLGDEQGRLILPSVVGLSQTGGFRSATNRCLCLQRLSRPIRIQCSISVRLRRSVIGSPPDTPKLPRK